MAWFKCGGGNAVSPVVMKTYAKFNGSGLVLPWYINSDYKIECVFHETTYYENTCITGSTGGWNNAPYIANYQNNFDMGTGTGYVTIASWSAGEHTYINNNENDKNSLDGVEGAYTPNSSMLFYTIGCRGNVSEMGYKGYIKSFKIYSKTTGDLLHDLKPCKVYNLSAFYDTVEDLYYTCLNLEATDTLS